MLNFALNLIDAGDVEAAALPHRVGCMFRDKPEFSHSLGGIGLDLEPDAKLRLGLPNASHLGTAIARDHSNVGAFPREGDRFSGFNDLALPILSTIGAFLLAVAVVPVLSRHGMAFETENAAATVPGGTTQFQDPDENLLMAPTNNETLPLLKDDTSNNAQTSGSTLQLAPGTTLQIMGGSGPSSL